MSLDLFGDPLPDDLPRRACCLCVHAGKGDGLTCGAGLCWCDKRRAGPGCSRRDCIRAKGYPSFKKVHNEAEQANLFGQE